MGSVLLKNPINNKTHYSHFCTNQNKYIFEIERQLKSTKYHNKYFVKILQVDDINTTGSVLLNISKDSLFKLEIGQVYYTKTSLIKIDKPKNPYSFNYHSYLKKHNIYHQINLIKSQIIYLETRKSLQTSILKLRNYFQKSLEKQAFEKNSLGVINALVLGQRQDISKDLLKSYAGAGAIHILAVSGLHIGVIFLIINFLLKPLEVFKYGKHYKTFLIILFLWFYAFLTGLSGSVVRAVTMFSFIAIGLLIRNHRSSVLHALISSFFILVLIQPLYIFEVGFQMSYAAVLGIVLLYPQFQLIIPKSKWYLLKKIIQLLIVSISATIGTLPISLYYFHQFPGLFFLSNIVIVPFVGLIMIIGIITIILASINNLPDWFAFFYNTILSWMNQFIQWVALQERFIFKNISFSFEILIATYLIISLMYLYWRKPKTKRLVWVLLSIVVFQSVLFIEKYNNETTTELVFFNKTRQSIIGLKTTNHLKLYSSLDSISTLKQSFINSYFTAKNITNFSIKNALGNIVRFTDKNILIIDSLGVYKNLSLKPDIILLRQSPKINMKRLIDIYPHQLIIADASNYKSVVKIWKETCRKNHNTFLYTVTDGAFVIQTTNNKIIESNNLLFNQNSNNKYLTDNERLKFIKQP
jgi:competence protein ComEC